MSKRPDLNKNLSGADFRNYYYLKEELVTFCRENGLPASGGKQELTDRIICFLETGNVLPSSTAKKKPTQAIGTITEDTVIESNIVCSEKHRAFFIGKIGKSFSFCVPFQKWLKENAGKTYGDSVLAYGRILAEKRQGKTASSSFNTWNA